MISKQQIDEFNRNGFLLLKQVFTPDEVLRFREAGVDAPRACDLAAIPAIAHLWSDERLVAIAGQLLGDPVTYFGEASYAHEIFAPGPYIFGRHLHHDAKGTIEHLFNRQHAPTPKPYPIIRFAIYLQDHATRSGGLKVVPGSHLIDSSHFDQETLLYFDVPSEPGDLVVFCNKLLHSPYALRLAAEPGRGLAPLQEVMIAARQPDIVLPGPLDRRVIFIDFAGHAELADIYIKSRAINPTAVTQGQALAAAVMEKQATEAGLALRLDAAVVEVMRTLKKTAIGGKISAAGKPYLAALPHLCRLSQEWFPRFGFVPTQPVDDSVQSAVAAYSFISGRINDLLPQWSTMQADQHMGVYEATDSAQMNVQPGAEMES